MRILAIDPGKRVLGLAWYDDALDVVLPKEPMRIGSPEEGVQKIANLVREENYSLILMGYPFNMDGTPSEMCTWVEKFIHLLQEHTSVPIQRVDERLSTWEAQNRMGKKWKKQQYLDSIAAVVLLEDYLHA